MRWTKEEARTEEAFLEECKAAQIMACLKERSLSRESNLRLRGRGTEIH